VAAGDLPQRLVRHVLVLLRVRAQSAQQGVVGHAAERSVEGHGAW
jgi:hypothetical protein